jgi:hypothetical protein
MIQWRECRSPGGQCPRVPEMSTCRPLERRGGQGKSPHDPGGRERHHIGNAFCQICLSHLKANHPVARTSTRVRLPGNRIIPLEKPRISSTQTRIAETIMAGIKQTTSGHYLKRENLQELLEELFPNETDFDITVRLVNQRGFKTVDSRRMDC